MFTLIKGLLRTFPMLCQWGGAQEPAGSIGRGADPTGQKGIPYHEMSCPVYKSWPGAAKYCLGTGWASVSRCWATVVTIAYFSWILFLALSFSFPLKTVILLLEIINNKIEIINFLSIIKLFLYQPKGFYFFSNFPPHPTKGVGNSLTNGIVPSYQLGLNCKIL